ncbi:MAG: hypothetical protein V7751_19555 [Pseudoalteromonas distincta]
MRSKNAQHWIWQNKPLGGQNLSAVAQQFQLAPVLLFKAELVDVHGNCVTAGALVMWRTERKHQPMGIGLCAAVDVMD